MQLYAIRRRNGWNSPEALKQAAARSSASATRRCPTTCAGSAATSRRGQRPLGTVCIYEATSPAAIRKHADRADLPADEIPPSSTPS